MARGTITEFGWVVLDFNDQLVSLVKPGTKRVSIVTKKKFLKY